MWLKIVLLLTILSVTQSSNKFCSNQRTLDALRRSTYEFSFKLLDSVFIETKFDNFVFSPIATWLQLTSLAEGANNETLKEIIKVTKHPTLQCLKRKWKKLINKMNYALKMDLQLRNMIIINKLFSVKKKFLRSVEKLHNVDVLLYNFNSDSNKVANDVNNFIDSETGGTVSQIVDSDYFSFTDLVSVGMLNYNSSWKFAFKKENTEIMDFYSFTGTMIGEVYMMKGSGYFNVTYISVIKSKVLELPCSNERISLLIFLPKSRKQFLNFFYLLRKIELRSIFTQFNKTGQQFINVELPRFKISFDYDNIPELIFDLGARKMFTPDADFKGLSDYPILTSMMTQVADIEVTEEGVKANATIQNLTKMNRSVYKDFIANKPFVFMLVDKELELVLFAGVHSQPSVYD